MTWLIKLRNLWPGALRQQVTRTGMIYAAAVALVATASFLTANNLMFLILAAMLSVLLISGFVSKLGLAGLEIDLLLPEHIAARSRIRARVRLKNLKRWMPSFSIHVEGLPGSGVDSSLYFPVLPGRATIEEPVDLFFPTRGRWRERTFQFTTRFPFGFAERREWVTTRHDVIVYPCLDPRPGFEELLADVAGEVEARQRGPGSDFHRIRPYEALETARHVDWKATAHTGALQVREFARDEEQRVLLYLDLDAGEQERAWFETAVECCAFLAYHLANRGVHVRFRTQQADFQVPEADNIFAVLGYLALVAPLRGRPPAHPDEDAYFPVVFTIQPERLTKLGWHAADRGTVLGPEAFPA